MAIGVAILGSTGSIGRSALAVLERHTDRFRVVALTANRSGAELAAQVERYQPKLAVLVEGESDPWHGMSPGTRWCRGSEGLLEAVAHPEVEIVINAVVGAAGLRASLETLLAGKRLALANKESLVVGGPLVLDALRRGGGELIPVDSEHSAILQCLRGTARSAEVERLVLTASGGPFRGHGPEALAEVTPSEALRHPTWEMGAKITIDSATLANKALEVIEAHFLFGMGYDSIEVVVHPQSIIHSMVEFTDGSVLAQLGFPTMELPILYALSYPERVVDHGTRFDPIRAGALTFEALDEGAFPAFRLGVEAGRMGGTAPAVFNAANEIAVAAFLAEELPFPGIAELIERVLSQHRPEAVGDIETVVRVDGWARAQAQRILEDRC